VQALALLQTIRQASKNVSSTNTLAYFRQMVSDKEGKGFVTSTPGSHVGRVGQIDLFLADGSSADLIG